ncbi:hypothetical protein [Actinoplanes sp. N902-109]|uniref:hypothetical protein n=1 Tax=Actinoplanes sp. (strain N902-109) TaxID=649831 RepID=UPI0003294DFE|nr:hypothetical protein [Actinoplanes sp. N902-109]AGL19760.1 hypothetical protein L083_6250 [Actinoplanes sp. N902-109]
MTDGRPGKPDLQWGLALLPALPLILLVGRLWLSSGRDEQTMLLLVQHISPVSLIVKVASSLLWVSPIFVLVGRMLDDYRVVSVPIADAPTDPWILRLGRGIPDWLVCLAGCFATVMWELQYLPSLGAILIVIVCLGIRRHYPTRRRLATGVTIALPLLAAMFEYAIFGTALIAALTESSSVTVLLLGLPPVLTIILAGPLPAFAARPATLLPALSGFFLVPLLIATTYLHAPLLPLVAVEVSSGGDQEPLPPVLVGYMVTIEDHVATMMDDSGSIRFIPIDRIISQTICPHHPRTRRAASQ